MELKEYNNFLKSSRKIHIELVDRVLVGYADKNTVKQTDEYKNFTKEVYEFQKTLSERGFPVFEVGKLINLDFCDLTLFEEFSSKSALNLKYTLKKKFVEDTIFRTYFVLYDYGTETKEFVSCFYALFHPESVLMLDKKGTPKFDMMSVTKCDIMDWAKNFKYFYDGFKVDVFKYVSIIENVKEKGKYKKWKSLSLVENVKRKMAQRFRKDISLDPKDLLLNVATTSYGATK